MINISDIILITKGALFGADAPEADTPLNLLVITLDSSDTNNINYIQIKSIDQTIFGSIKIK